MLLSVLVNQPRLDNFGFTSSDLHNILESHIQLGYTNPTMSSHKTPLGPYVLRARQGPNFPKTTTPIFNWIPETPYSVPYFKTPILSSDRENTVPVFPGNL